MGDKRIQEHPVLGALEQVEIVSFRWQGELFEARKGEPIAAALMAHGIKKLRLSEVSGQARGVYCAIGHCMECRVTVNGQSGVRACLTPVQGGEEITS